MTNASDFRKEAEALRSLARRISFLPDKAQLDRLALDVEKMADEAHAEEERSWSPPK